MSTDPEHADTHAASSHGPSAAPSTGTDARRTHPLTPLLTGWKIMAAAFAVIAAQNLARLIEEFTARRALLGAGALVLVLLLAIGFSALVWWRTTYEISADGVTLRSGLLTRTGRTAPRERIESVSVERPAVPRLLGLAKVRVEFAGGSDSFLDIDYVTSADAESIRRRILDVAGRGPASGPTSDTAATSAPGTTSQAGATGGDAAASRGRSGLEEVIFDGVTEGELIARIPTTRLLHSMLRDIGWMLGLLLSALWIVATIVIAWRTDGLGVGLLATAVPAIIAIPQALLHRIEGGWGFVSRDTERGLRMRRGLLSTRTDNLGAGRVQDMRLRRPLLWRGPGWTDVRVSVAGIGEDDASLATSALPVGTREELARTLGHLLPVLGSEDDETMIEHLLTAPARELEGLRPVHRLFFVGRRTRRVLLLPGALVRRSGVITPKIQIIPRERIQGMTLAQGPIGRLTGSGTLTVGVAAGRAELNGIPLGDLLDLEEHLAPDAALGRRYSERASWPNPPLSPAASAAPARATDPTGPAASAAPAGSVGPTGPGSDA